jgi:hypothetical protein
MRHKESQLQIQCVRWFRYAHHDLYDVLFAVPNGGARNKAEASIIKSEGVISGVSDLLLLHANCAFHGLCVEMKTEGSYYRQTDNQKRWQRSVEAQGYKYIVCDNIDSFMTEVDNYLNN